MGELYRSMIFLTIGLLIMWAWFIPYVQPTLEGFQQQSDIVICLLCVCPTERVLAFASKYAETHPVYVVCDDPNCKVPDNMPFTFVKLTDEVCKTSGYTGANPAITKQPSAWDKAIYYFCTQKTDVGYVWFIEEDVFVPRESLFKELDKRFPTTDFIMKQNVKDTDDPSFEFWYDGEGKLERPFYRSLVCVTRVSRRLLNLVKELQQSKQKLVFIEMMFNTLAVHNDLSMQMPTELLNIIFRHTWTAETVNKDNFFHPVKDTELHDAYRARLAQKTESNMK